MEEATLYSTEYQRAVLKLFSTNIQFAMNYGILLKSEYFETKPSKIIFEVIQKHILTYEKEIDKSSLLVQLEEYSISRGYSSDVVVMLREEVKEVFNTYIKSEQFIIDMIVKYCRRQEMKNALIQSIDILQKDGDYEQVLKKIDNAVSIGAGAHEGLTFTDLRNLPHLYRERYKVDKLIETGYPKFDQAMMGGLAPGELHVFQSPPKCGKSTLACNIGAHNLYRKRNVYHVSLEISDVDVMSKYATRITGLNYSEFLTISDEAYTKKLNFFNTFKPNLFVNFWPEKTANCLNIRSWISRKRAQTGLDPDIILVDYDDPLTGDTLIPMLDGSIRRIDSLVGEKEFWLYACKENGEVVPGRGHSARVAREVDELVEITLDNGETIRSTINHNHMLRDGSYKRADMFITGDFMMPLYKSKITDYENIRDNKTGQFEATNIMVVSVKFLKLEKPIPVYCLTVDDYQNYALNAGVFTHNCLLPVSGKREDMYNEAGEIYSDLIGLASYFKCPVVTFAQPNRDSWSLPNTGELIRSSHLAHSARKAHKCYSISSLNFADDSTTGILYLDIARRGKSGVKIKMERDLDKGIFREIV